MSKHTPPVQNPGEQGEARLLQRVRHPGATVEVYEDDGHRWLQNGNGTLQSLMDRRAPERLVLPYTARMMAALLFMDAPEKILMLGLGGASHARFLHHHYPEARISAFEAHPQIIALARRYFHLPGEAQGLRVINADVGAGFDATDGSADLILLDVFDAQGLPPWVPEEALQMRCRRALGEAGVLSANLWVDADDEHLSVLHGMQAAFEHRILALGMPGYRNLVVLAFKNPPRLDFATLATRAARLSQRTDLDFAAMLDALRASNASDASGFLL